MEAAIIIIGFICAVLIIILIKGRKKQLLTQTALKKVINQLNETNHIDNAIFCSVHAYILFIDSSFKVLKTNVHTLDKLDNKRVGDLLLCVNGKTSKNGCGTSAYCPMCPIRQCIQRAFDTKTSFKDLRFPLHIYNGNEKKELLAMISGSYLLMKGRPYMVLTIHDITKLNKIEEEMRAKKEAAEQSSVSKSAFLANMSHEIRTPLNAIVGFSDILASTDTKDERMQYQEIIKSNANLLLQLVNDILDVSKIEAGMLDFNYADVDINLMLSDLHQQALMKLEGSSSSVNLVKSLGAENCVAKTDRVRVSQVISNFLSNAMKYAAQGQITMGYEVRGDNLYFFVKDNGKGISKEDLSKLFERFYRVDRTKSGTGLGLAISKTIVDKLGGKIGADSELEKGSTFWFTIPYVPSDSVQTV